MAFGPQRGRPPADRLAEIAREATTTEIEAAIELAHAIEARAWQLTEPSWNEGGFVAHSAKEVNRRARLALADEYPFLPPKTISRLLSQAHYFHSK